MPVVTVDWLKQEQCVVKRSYVFSEEIKRDDCSVSDATACPRIVGKMLSLKHLKQNYEGNENSKAGTK